MLNSNFQNMQKKIGHFHLNLFNINFNFCKFYTLQKFNLQTFIQILARF